MGDIDFSEAFAILSGTELLEHRAAFMLVVGYGKM